jgi:uncharacterized protein DUF2510
MTSLAGEFHTDLPMPDALAACADAVHGLGWKIESVQPRRIVSYSDSSADHSPKVEIILDDSGEETDVRIIGSDTEESPLEEDALVAELDRVRDAIEAAIDEASDMSGEVPEQSEVSPDEAEESELGPTQTSSGNGHGKESSAGEAAVAPAGWYADPEGQDERWWDGERWTERYRPVRQDSDEEAPDPEQRPAREVAERTTSKDLLWGLSLAFGAVGGTAAAFGVPVVSFYIPLGFGIAGAALAIAAWTTPGKSPWWAIVAVIASIAGIVVGADGYSQYNDIQNKLDQAQQQLQELNRP